MSKIKEYINKARGIVGKERVMTDEMMRLAWGTDAGFYRLIPKVVVHAANEQEVSKLLRLASDIGVGVTFRAAGTSLSGQAIGDEILIVAGKGWEDWRLGDKDALTITLQPGLTGKKVNDILKSFGRKFSPDPASVNSAMVGGIVANNASGMNCGTHANSHRVLQSVRMILADGTILDTGDILSRESFQKTHKETLAKIKDLRDYIRGNKELSDRIKKKYSIKNVVGLNLLPFIEFDNPLDIMAHLLVGSEGTLAFISEVTVSTEKIVPLSASAMIYFKDVVEACRAVQRMKSLPVVSAELLDTKSLLAVNDEAGERGLTAVLTETRADTEDELLSNIAKIKNALAEFSLDRPIEFSTDEGDCGRMWQIRSGVFPAVGATRPIGKTVLIEDIAFHIEDLPQATVDLLEVLKKHGYDDACIYGHVLEGNYHFIISQSFDSQEEIDRYRGLMEEVERLVVDKYDGSLKAEHGTGRNMAPFVAKEWGEDAWNVMKSIKDIFDPGHILNKGVIFNDDPLCYISNLKPLPESHSIIDRCIECGFCEINCVSCGYGLSSRQRIVISREISRLEKDGSDPERLKALKEGFAKFGDRLCAGDGLCATSCPVKINTGEFIHFIREQNIKAGSVGYAVGRSAAKNLKTISHALRPVLKGASLGRRILGEKLTNRTGELLNKVGVPLWTGSLPDGNFHRLQRVSKSSGISLKKVVYFPSCINRTMGASVEPSGRQELPLTTVMQDLMRKAGYEPIIPKGIDNLCCGMIWESKGMPDIADQKLKETHEALLAASNNGEYPIVCDQSPCLHRLREHISDLKLYEPAEFIHDYLVKELDFSPEDKTIALHLTCSTRQMAGVAQKIENLAKMCVTNVVLPEGVGCCGFAGDKGFTHPGLNKHALRNLRPVIERHGIKEGYSNSRTCEIGLSTNSGVPYKSIVYLVDRVTKPKVK